MKKIFSIAFFVAAFAIGSQAQEKPADQHGKHKGKKEWNKKAKDELNLTTAQQEQMKSINTEFRSQAKAIRDNKSLSADQQKQQMKTLHTQRTEKVKAILTPEQQQKLAQHKRPERKQGRKVPPTK